MRDAAFGYNPFTHMIGYGLVVHGGAGSPPAWKDGCAKAAASSLAKLREGTGALEAAVSAAVALEDDGRFNAGSGSSLRLDGTTIEMDASVMDSRGGIGCVAAIQRVRNPVLVAREVMKSPHIVLSGEGAVGFARRCGFEDYYKPSSHAREAYEAIRKALTDGRFEEMRDAWRNFDLRRHWNFPVSYEKIFAGCDTIGVVALDRDGTLATACSTGGASPMLHGRVGDTPLVGCGFYAGAAAAVATTGIGEEIIRRMLARAVHDWIAQGEEVARACERGVASLPAEVPVGVIAISRRGAAIAANRDMAAVSEAV
ncbi:MAG TPA: isoaspartyl peptidase/L-asparaginase [Planctomycetota bacterium]|jgi:L-asparaginase/beta-aspartyl-peptidase (threonine type)